MEAMAPTDQEPTAIQNFADAWETYFKDASVMGAPTVPGSLAGAKSAMIGAMTGLSTAGAAAISAGITAFWGVVAGASASIWPGTLAAIPAPGIGGVAAAITPVFAANTAGKLEIGPAMQAIAAAIHPTQLGGIANFPPPPGGLGPQPIL
jgi:hypothetical protein